jgi:site-specific DNA recombinase
MIVTHTVTIDVVHLTTLMRLNLSRKGEPMTTAFHRKDDRLRAVTYLRVASSDQDDQRRSIAAQRHACQSEAERLGAVVTDEFADIGASGNSKERDGLQRLMTRIAEQPVDCVIVRDRARLARNRADDVAINLAIREAGAELVSVSENIDQAPSDPLLDGIMSSVAEFSAAAKGVTP